MAGPGGCHLPSPDRKPGQPRLFRACLPRAGATDDAAIRVASSPLSEIRSRDDATLARSDDTELRLVSIGHFIKLVARLSARVITF